MKASDITVGELVRIPDGRTGVVALVRGTTVTVRLLSGYQLLFAPSQLKAVR